VGSREAIDLQNGRCLVDSVQILRKAPESPMLGDRSRKIDDLAPAAEIETEPFLLAQEGCQRLPPDRMGAFRQTLGHEDGERRLGGARRSACA
jgi:hypothetical protein